jgi:multicomponent Na+:H+ antiporter subunit A
MVIGRLALSTLLLFSLAGSVAAWPVARRTGKAAGWVLALIPAALFVGFIGLATTIEAGRSITERHLFAPALGVEFTLRLDGFALLFCLLVTGIGAFVVIYAGAYLSEHSRDARARFFTLILLFMTAMLGAVLADDMIVLFFFWEATSVLSFLLIGFDAGSASARRAALMSLRITVGGGLALLAAIILIGAELGTYSMGEVISRAPELGQSPWIVPIIFGLFIGAFTKSAQFPFHFWLPNAMQAPTPASAYLHSATMVKLGVYLLARFEPVIGAVPGARDVLVGVALVTMVTGAFQALRAENFKSVLAYSTVTSLGILMMLVGLDGPMAGVATVGFILAHALYKATLFFCAGTVLHATGLSKLRHMGGLRRFLPVTAVAAALASLSMAGLPPFLGFISKEFLFEAQIQSSRDAVPVAAAVLVNAVIVGVAGVVTLRPFFLGDGRVREVKHREVPGLVAGPVVLALLGLVISLEPDWVSRAVLRPAVAAIYGSPVDVKVGLWHGVTPMLVLSSVVIGVGALIFAFWIPIHRQLQQSPLHRFDVEHGYDALLRRISRLAAATSQRMQHGDLRGYMWVAIAAALAFGVYGAVASGSVPRLPAAWGELRIGPAAAALVGLAGGIAATRARSLLAAMIAVGLAGLITALIFMMNGAPDLALTQFAVESLVVVLLTVALFVVPLRAPSTRTRSERASDAALAAACAVAMFVVLLDMSASTQPGDISRFFGERSYVAAFGRNVVNVILVDFRGFDTLGETAVIALSAMIAWSLLGPRDTREEQSRIRSSRAAFILTFTSPVFFWLLLALSIVVLLRGHNEIGGGFVGGLTAALAFAIVSLAHGVESARAKLRLHPLSLAGGGLLLALLSGLPGLLVRGDFLSHVWIDMNVLGLQVKQGTTLLFDLGVYTAVLGTVLSFLFGLRREAAR